MKIACCAPRNFNDDKKDAGDLGAGHQVTAIYETLPAGSEEETARIDRLRYQQGTRKHSKSRAGELAWIKLAPQKPDSNKSELLEWPVSANADRLQCRASRCALRCVSSGIRHAAPPIQVRQQRELRSRPAHREGCAGKFTRSRHLARNFSLTWFTARKNSAKNREVSER